MARARAALAAAATAPRGPLPAAAARANPCAGPAPERVDCGIGATTEAQCVPGGCCWHPFPSPNPNHYPACFRPHDTPAPAPPPPPTPPPTPAVTTPGVPAPGEWRLQWADEFSGDALNPKWWSVGTLRGPPTAASPDGDLIPGAYGDHRINWKHLDYVMADDVILDSGVLRLRSQRRNVTGTDPGVNFGVKFNFTAGWVQSMHKVSYTYGYTEARIRYPLGAQVHAAFWTIEERLVWGTEWDIAEYYGTPWKKACHAQAGTAIDGPDLAVQTVPLEACCTRCKNAPNGALNVSCPAAVWNPGGDGACHFKRSAAGAAGADAGATTLVPGPAGLLQNLHTGDYPANNWYDTQAALCDDPSSAPRCAVTDWHTYGLRWGPDGYEWYIDGALAKSVSAADVAAYPTDPVYFVLNNGVPFWDGHPTDATGTPWPNYADFDYVRVYKEVGADGSLVGGGVFPAP